MAGLYLHIPFCKQACYYCDFHFSTSLGQQASLVEALLQEMELRAEAWQTETFSTLYFGGGTPSLLTEPELNSIMQAASRLFRFDADVEITLEANPDDLTVQKLNELKDAGINRLSIGIQSFREEDLQRMNRAHNAREAVQCIRLARELGFDNLTADLIYALPELTDADWVANVDQLMAMQLPHFSAYSLTVEEKTPLEAYIRKGKIAGVADEVAPRQFELLMDMAATHGYEHYEISNFARPGHQAKHNSNYWNGSKYLGIGPSAHSFDGEKRWWNVSNNSKYIQAIKAGKLPAESENLDLRTRYNEYILTALRTAKGVSVTSLQQQFGPDFERHFLNVLAECEPTWYQFLGDKVRLTRAGKHFADRMASDLFILSDDFI